MRPLTNWWRALSPRVRDVVIAAVVALPTLLDAWWNAEATRQADLFTYTVGAVSVGALLFRSRWPKSVALVCGLALTSWYVAGHYGELLILPTMVALYTVAAKGDRRTSVTVGLAAAAWSGTLGFVSTDPAGAAGSSPVLEMLWPLVPLALGEATRARRELMAEHAARVAQAKLDQQLDAQRRVDAERIRLARDVHDVVAHAMVAVNVQMTVATAAFDAQPETARTALVQARASSREALQELRASIDLLRTPDDESATRVLGPVHLEGLAAVARSAGISVTIRNADEYLNASPATQITVYRIVQEALTNVIRHSDAEHVKVVLSDQGPILAVGIADNGTGSDWVDPAVIIPPTEVSGPPRGLGLAGMTERVRGLGGTIEYGPRPTGGFVVRVALPRRAG